MFYKYLFLFTGLQSFELDIKWPLNILWRRKKTPINKLPGNDSINIHYQYESKNDYVTRMTLKERLRLYVLVFYFFVILGFLTLDAIYILRKLILNTDDTLSRQYLGYFSLYLIAPVNYVWLKYYLSSDHLFVILTTFRSSDEKNHDYRIFLLASVVLSIIYCSVAYPTVKFSGSIGILSSNTDILYIWVIRIIIELIGKTLVFHNYIISILVFYEHDRLIKKFIEKIQKGPSLELNNTKVLTHMICELNIIKFKLECSIYYFNTLIFMTTVLISFACFMFFDVVFRLDAEPEKYLYPLILIIFHLLCQSLFFFILYSHGEKRQKLYKAVVSQDFMYRYIYSNTIHMTDKANSANVILNWMILKEMLEKGWVDFEIFGISVRDGNLIKKLLALGSILIIVFSSQ